MQTVSSSGYNSIFTTPLARVGYHDKIIARMWERDYLPEITNTEIASRIIACDSEVQLIRQPDAGEWVDYELNQEVIPDQVSPEAFTLKICNYAVRAIKVDDEDIRRACDRWEQWEDSFLDSSYQGLVKNWRKWVLSAMVLEASERNKNNTAGAYGTVQLGAPGAPLLVTKDNVMYALSLLERVLREANRWEDGKMFVVIPTALKSILAMSEYGKANLMGACVSCAMGIDGLMPVMLWGFKTIESSDPLTANDSTGDTAYYIIAGHRDAFGFAGDVVKSRVFEDHNFGTRYQMLAAWGGKAIYPDGLAIGYWTFGA